MDIALCGSGRNPQFAHCPVVAVVPICSLHIALCDSVRNIQNATHLLLLLLLLMLPWRLQSAVRALPCAAVVAICRAQPTAIAILIAVATATAATAATASPPPLLPLLPPLLRFIIYIIKYGVAVPGICSSLPALCGSGSDVQIIATHTCYHSRRCC